MIVKVRHYMPLLAATMLVGILLFQGWQLTSLLSEREWEYSDNLLHNLSGRAQASLGRRFEERDPVAVRQVMSELYLFKRRSIAFLIDDQGRVIASDHLGYENSPLNQVPIHIDPAQLRRARATLQGNIVQDRATGRLTAYYPVSTSADGQIPFSQTAVLVISLEVAQGMEEVRDYVQQSILSSLALVILMVSTIAIGLHFALTRRVGRILAVANAYLAGDVTARNAQTRPDELGDIAMAFNRVVDAIAEKQDRLEHSQAALQELNHTLEQRVSDRTVALKREVDERTRAEMSLRTREAELQSVLELAPDGIVVISQAGVIVKFNAAAQRITGWSEADILGRNVDCLMPEPHHSQHHRYLQAYRDTGVARIIGREQEVEAIRKDGERYPIALSVSEVDLNGEPHFIGVIRDISDRKAAEAALATARQGLVQAEKLAALGGLVAGIAHEINTPVGVGVTASSHLAHQVDAFAAKYAKGDMKRSDLEALLATCTEASQIIEDNLSKASQLIRSFKDIAVDQTGDEVRTIRLEDYIQQILTSLRPRLKTRPIEVTVVVEPEALEVELRPGGISQIVTNLVMNALTHAFAEDAPGKISLTAQQMGAGFQLICADNGKGMTQDLVTRIFEPFFTTKRGQGGSGLGMHIVFNLMTQTYGGSIACESMPGSGTRFIMTFPNCVIQPAKDA